MIRKLGTPLLILLLLVFSIILYLVQNLLFHNPEESAFLFLQDLAFVPISVLLVTLGLNTVMVYRERQKMLEKISIVINEFFAETGAELIHGLRNSLTDLEGIRKHLSPEARWTDKDFQAAIVYIGSKEIQIDINPGDLPAMHQMLVKIKDQILRLFENPNLMEHDRFTDMLWAVYHVYDELRSRSSLENLPETDLRHLKGDLQRASRLLLVEWLDCMRALRTHYPYLYSLAVRKNPFGESQVIIES
jgi:hypothetical protein